MRKVRVGSGSAGWPDLADAAWDVARHGNLDYMGLDHLAELTMAILYRQKIANPKRGYIPDTIPLMKGLLPIWKATGRRMKIVDNGGGANPEQCAEEVIRVCKDISLGPIKIGVITGDMLPLEKIDSLAENGFPFKNLDNGEVGLDRIRQKLLAAYVYVGGDKVIEAFEQGANLVLAGRLADNSLFVPGFMHGLGWKFGDEYWDRIGSAVIASHLLECGSWATGCSSNLWAEVPEPWHPSMPICEMDDTGEAVFSITPTSGGIMRELTLKEHLLYEVHDPCNYLMPDGIGDITTVKFQQIGKDVVKMSKSGDRPRGKKRPDTLKLCLVYHDGYASEYTMVVPGPGIWKRVEKTKEYVQKRLELSGLKPTEWSMSLIGYNSILGPAAPPLKYEPPELGFRFAFKCNTKDEARECRVQAGTLSWNAAGIGNAFGNSPADRDVYALWPTLIPRESVPLNLEVRDVK